MTRHSSRRPCRAGRHRAGSRRNSPAGPRARAAEASSASTVSNSSRSWSCSARIGAAPHRHRPAGSSCPASLPPLFGPRNQGSGTGSALNLNTAPERHMVLDCGGCLFRIGIVPCGIAVFDAIDHYRMVMGRTLPGTHGGGIRRLEIFAADGIGRKVDVPSTNSKGHFRRSPYHSRWLWPCHPPVRTGTERGAEGTWAVQDRGKTHRSFREDGAQEKTRTSTTFRPQVPETCASTNSRHLGSAEPLDTVPGQSCQRLSARPCENIDMPDQRGQAPRPPPSSAVPPQPSMRVGAWAGAIPALPSGSLRSAPGASRHLPVQ